MGKGTRHKDMRWPSLKSIYKAEISPLSQSLWAISTCNNPPLLLLCVWRRPVIKPKDLSTCLTDCQSVSLCLHWQMLQTSGTFRGFRIRNANIFPRCSLIITLNAARWGKKGRQSYQFTKLAKKVKWSQTPGCEDDLCYEDLQHTSVWFHL